jgi:hypothetical protein
MDNWCQAGWEVWVRDNWQQAQLVMQGFSNLDWCFFGVVLASILVFTWSMLRSMWGIAIWIFTDPPVSLPMVTPPVKASCCASGLIDSNTVLAMIEDSTKEMQKHYKEVIASITTSNQQVVLAHIEYNKRMLASIETLVTSLHKTTETSMKTIETIQTRSTDTIESLVDSFNCTSDDNSGQ